MKVKKFWSDATVRAGLKRLARAIKLAQATTIVEKTARQLRDFAEVVRVLEHRDRCRVSPQLHVRGSTPGAAFWSLYLDCTDTKVVVQVFGEEKLLPDGDVIITDGRYANWSAEESSAPTNEELDHVCEVLEREGPWHLGYRICRPAVD